MLRCLGSCSCLLSPPSWVPREKCACIATAGGARSRTVTTPPECPHSTTYASKKRKPGHKEGKDREGETERLSFPRRLRCGRAAAARRVDEKGRKGERKKGRDRECFDHRQPTRSSRDIHIQSMSMSIVQGIFTNTHRNHVGSAWLFDWTKDSPALASFRQYEAAHTDFGRTRSTP
jgi:hypothetical protein